MAYVVPTFSEIRNKYLQAVLNQNPAAAIGPDSDHFVRASATAAVLEGVYSHQAWVFRQAFPDLADSDFMEKMANQRGLTRKAAATAGGTVRFNGTAGTAIPLGQQVATAQGVSFATTAAGVVGVGGTVDIAASAVAAGASGNQSNNTPATVSAPPAGISSAATILTMTGGAEVEDDAGLLLRLLLELSEVPQGGNATDYKRWALEVPGVDRVFVFDVRRGNGTVDVVPMPVSGLPGAPLLAAVQAVIDDKRPVGLFPGAGALALAPTAVSTAVTAALTFASGYTLAAVSPLAQAAIESVFSKLEPGSTLVRNQLITALLNVPGVTDVTLSAPAANVTCLVNATTLELIMPGVITISLPMLTRDALIACLPPQAYDRTAPGVQAEAAVAAEVLDGAIQSSDVILVEHQPGSAALALPDWERNHGLPDACIGGADASAAQRRANLLERISARGNLSRSYFINLAESLGYPGCTITEFGPMTCADPCDSYVNSPEFIGVWRLNIPTPTAVIVMTCESACDASLAIGGNAQLECLINRRKPAHTKAVFTYAP